MVIHNVHNRRKAWIGPWEAEDQPVEIANLVQNDVGREVIYHDHHRAEIGTISSWRDGLVFVRFHHGDTSAACNPRDLHFALRDATPDYYRVPVL